MLSGRTLQKIAQLVRCIAEGERKVEVVRQVLAENRLFEMYTTFKRLDRVNKGYLVVSDFQDFLVDNNVSLSTYDIQNIFSLYDISGNGRCTFAEFKTQLLPRENNSLVNMVNARNSYAITNGYLPYEVEWSLSKVFSQDASNIRDQENYRDVVQSSYDYNLRDAFDTIDQDRVGYLNVYYIDKFLQLQGITLTDEELEAFFRIADPTGNQKVFYLQFSENVLTSKNVRKYIGLEGRTNRNELSPRAARTFSAQKMQDSLARSISPPRSRFYSPSRSRRVEIETHGNNFYPRQSVFLNGSQVLSPTLKNSRVLADVNLGSPYRSGVILSPMRTDEEENFVRSLKEMIQVNRELEASKNQLAVRSDFSLLDGFRYFDIKGIGFINANEFTLVCEEFGIFPTRDQVNLFFTRFDKDSDSYLRYADFCKMYTPNDVYHANLLKSRQPFSYMGSNFSLETRRLVRRLFDLLINSEVQAEQMRQRFFLKFFIARLQRRPLFRLDDAFGAVDRYETGFVSIEEFRQILEDYGIYTDLKDLQGLVGRFDKTQQGNVSYSEFVKEMSPKSPQRH